MRLLSTVLQVKLVITEMIWINILANLETVADIPVLTGFGVSTKADIERFNKVSDGVIVRTKIVRDLHEGKADDVEAFVTYDSNYQK